MLGGDIKDMMTIISAAVTPVVLISALAIFFSALTAKHSHLADQFRQIAAELRRGESSETRQNALTSELIIFKHRMDALWLATGMLSISLLLFVCTVLVVIYSKWNPGAGALGVVFLILGLVLMVLSVIAECYEIALGRKSMTLELLDLSAKNISQINSKED
jgi:uncharacterized membrane protein